MATERVAVLAANRTFAIASSRLPLIARLREARWRVHVVAVPDHTAPLLAEAGVEVHPVAFARGGFAPAQDLAAYLRLRSLYRTLRPSLVHHFHAKPIILGSRVARQLPHVPRIVNTVTGLGHGFLGDGLRGRLARRGYRGAPALADAAIFQNPDDRREFVSRGLIADARTHLIVSSGVDLARFTPAPVDPPDPTVRVAMVARLLWDKGIREFVSAAEQVRQHRPDVEFVLGGEWDDAHPNAVERAWVQGHVDRGTIRFAGYIKDMPAFLRTLSTFVLPSYYGEGVPRVVLEAAACGVPVVTCDEPGCREGVLSGETGYLVPGRDSQALAEAVGKLLADPVRLAGHRRAARSFAESRFDIRAITEQQLAVYRAIGVDVP